jgi:hypothetical protein
MNIKETSRVAGSMCRYLLLAKKAIRRHRGRAEAGVRPVIMLQMRRCSSKQAYD